jgi:hypothetical protein
MGVAMVLTKPLSYVLMAVGVLCALSLRKLSAGRRRGWVKLAAFTLIGAGIFISSVVDLQIEDKRSITLASTTGTLINLHEESSGPRSSQTQHYNVDDGVMRPLPDLHDRDPLFFVKAHNGEQVEVIFTRESGYVSHLRVLHGGGNAGYAFNEPDVKNYNPAGFGIFIGFIVCFTGIIMWNSNRDADPSS